MAWQETPLAPDTHLDAETEREFRLVAQARAGAGWARAALIARYQPAVVRYLVRLTGDPVQARVLAERVFRRMERRIRGPHGGEYLRLWLLRACTESGLDALRHPPHTEPKKPQVEAPNPAGLLAERVNSSAQRLRDGLERIAERTDSTRRQVRQLIWSTTPQAAIRPPRLRRASQPLSDPADEGAEPSPIDPDLDTLDPREALRHRMIRAVVSELPYGDAQCLALHLIAGLNQAEVARALGIRPSAARHRIVVGLDRFAQRYDRALEELGISREFGYAENAPLTDAPQQPEQLANATPALGVPVAEMARERTELADGAFVAPAVVPTFTTPPSTSEHAEQNPSGFDEEFGGAEPAEAVGAFGADDYGEYGGYDQHDRYDAYEDGDTAPAAEAATPEPARRVPPVRVLDAPPVGPVVDAVAIASTLTMVDDDHPLRDDRELMFEPSMERWTQPQPVARDTPPVAPAEPAVDGTAETLMVHAREVDAPVVPVRSSLGNAATLSAEADTLPAAATTSGGEPRDEQDEPLVVPVRSQVSTPQVIPHDPEETREVPVRSPAGRR